MADTVLVFGASGYLGVPVCQAALDAGLYVIGIDNFSKGLQQSTALASCCVNPRFELVRGDVREPRDYRQWLKKADAVVNLAAVVGAPACARDREGAEQVNYHAVHLLTHELSPNQHLIYPNSNSGYGSMPRDAAPLTEDAALRPLSLYADTKFKGELAALRHPNATVFRVATVMGCSPRMRLDLLCNHFVYKAHQDGAIVLFDPDVRRNFVHVVDVASAFLWAIENDIQGVFNLGNDDSNLTKMQLCETIRKFVPNLNIFIADGSDPDKRDYTISNARLAQAGFVAKRSVEDTVQELLKFYRAFPLFTYGNF